VADGVMSKKYDIRATVEELRFIFSKNWVLDFIAILIVEVALWVNKR